MPITLGLDLGTNSIGWALLETQGDSQGRILAAGVRIFQEGVEKDEAKGTVEAKNAKRRATRMARRMKLRKKRRRAKLLRLLQKHGLLPENQDELRKILDKDPYEIRDRAVREKIELHELGRALYHICQRRGFKSGRKDRVKEIDPSASKKEQEKKQETGKVLKAIGELEKKLTESGSLTLGQYLHKQILEGKAGQRWNTHRVRNQYTLRRMYTDEVNAIWRQQQAYYPKLLTLGLREQVDQAIFHQRKLKPQTHLIGDCELEPGEKRCPKQSWFAQQFRLWKEVNNLVVLMPLGKEEPVPEEKRVELVQKLMQQKSMTFSAIRKILGIPLDSHKLNLEEGKRDKLLGNAAEATLIKAFGDGWERLTEEQRDQHRIKFDELMLEEDPDEFKKSAEEAFPGLSAKQIEMLMDYSGPTGYMGYSRKALQKLLPWMKQGMKEYDAKIAVYGERAGNAPALNKLPPVGRNIRNPVVVRTLTETRKVVNCLLRKYPAPDFIRIELVREMKQGVEKRNERVKDNREREKQKETIALEIGKEGVEMNRENWQKYLLAKEQEWKCPYTGKGFGLAELYSRDNLMEVDHIIPYSRCLNDGMMNKVVAFASANREKGNRTPREWKSGKDFEDMWKRVKDLPWPKRNRFSQEKIELDQFLERQLVDTGYIAREVVGYVGQLFPESERLKQVQVTRGGVTSELRHQWGLNSILHPDEQNLKFRDDHRHHAIDAIVIALTTRSHIKRLAVAHKSNLIPQPMPEPWKNFRGDVEKTIDGVLVSHRPDRKVSGPLHEETILGPTKEQDVYTKRVKLTALTGAAVGKIRDDVVREIVTQRCRDFDIEPGSWKKLIPPKVWKEPLYMQTLSGKRGPEIRSVRVTATAGNPLKFPPENPTRVVEPGSNHHIEFVEAKDKKGAPSLLARVVTTFEAKQRQSKGLPVVDRNPGEAMKFKYSLTINDVVEVNDNGKKILCRVQKISVVGERIFKTGMNIALRGLSQGGAVSESKSLYNIQSTNSWAALHIKKLNMDPIGSYTMAND
ncbi:MAG: CRISPR-associated endonuclease Cas9 [Myxococcota bacterium]|nr:CRISPR-associated endonuclease Cas9 [Myxococcota bacterium]